MIVDMDRTFSLLNNNPSVYKNTPFVDLSFIGL